MLTGLIFAKIISYGFLLQGNTFVHPIFHMKQKGSSTTSILDYPRANYKTKEQKLKAASGVILLRLCNSLLDSKLDRRRQIHGNLEELKIQEVPLPMKSLKISMGKNKSATATPDT